MRTASTTSRYQRNYSRRFELEYDQVPRVGLDGGDCELDDGRDLDVSHEPNNSRENDDGRKVGHGRDLEDGDNDDGHEPDNSRENDYGRPSR